MFIRFGLLVLFSLLSIFPARAQVTDIEQAITRTGSGDLVPNQLYRLRVQCTERESLSGINTVANGLFSQTTYTISHSVIVATAQPTLNAATGSDDLQKDIIALMPSFAVRATDKKDNRTSCSGDWFVVGGAPYYLIAIKSQSETHTPALLTRVLFKIPDIIPPLWSLFKTGTPLPEDVKTKLGNIKEVEDPLTKLLETFNQSKNTTVTRSLGQGTYVIRTPFSQITVSVSPIDGFVPDYALRLKVQLDGGDKIAENDDVAEKCGSIADKLSDKGVSKQTDIPFSLAYLASRSFPSAAKKSKVLDCLTSDYAMKAAELGDVLWRYVAGNSRRVTPSDVEAYFGVPLDQIPTQPRFSVVQDRIDNFITYLSRLTLNEPMNPGDLTELLRVTTPKLTLIDRTLRGLQDVPASELDIKDVVGYLKRTGYMRFGCYKQNAAGSMADSSIVSILAFKAKKGDSTTSFADTLVLRPIFLGLKVSRILISDNADIINPILTEFHNQCYGLKVIQ